MRFLASTLLIALSAFIAPKALAQAAGTTTPEGSPPAASSSPLQATDARDSAIVVSAPPEPMQPPDVYEGSVGYPYNPFGTHFQTAVSAGDSFGVSASVAGEDIEAISLDASSVGLGIIPIRLDSGGAGWYSADPRALPEGIPDGTHILKVVARNAGGESSRDIPLLVDNTPPTIRISSFSGPDGGAVRNQETALVSGSFDGTGSGGFPTGLVRIPLGKDCATPLPAISTGAPVELTERADGPFADMPVYLDFEDAAAATHCVKVVVAVADGAGNIGFATSSPIRFLQPGETEQGGVSSVLFLPGIEGSRLYDAHGKLWEPYEFGSDGVGGILAGIGDARVRALLPGAETGIHTKQGDIVESSGGADYYAAFAGAMDGLVAGGWMAAWAPVAYDWRLSLDELVHTGVERGDGVYYEEAPSTPYIEQELRALAAASKTGRVTIVAHSNGGLVAKALMQKLGGAETARLVDRVILVGVPQAGAPEAVGSLLFGADSGIPAPYTAGLLPIVSQAAGRALALASPVSYHLLPSAAYFSSVHDASHPVVAFGRAAAFAEDLGRYGASVGSWDALASFIRGDDGRMMPADGDLAHAAVGSAALIDEAAAEHATLDAWAPPASTSVYQIAGWGVDTVAGVRLYAEPRHGDVLGIAPRYRPVFVEDGDGTVPVPSALLMPAAGSTTRAWLDLARLDHDEHASYRHGQELEAAPVIDFIRSVLDGSPFSSPYLSETEPAPLDGTKRLRFILHGGDSLSVRSGSGSLAVNADGSIEGTLPGAQAGVFGEDQYASVPAGTSYEVIVAAAGAADLDIDEYGHETEGSATVSDIPLAPGLTGTLSLSGLDDAVFGLDADGDGETDATSTVVAGADMPFAEEAGTSTLPAAGGAADVPGMETASSTDATSTPPDGADDEGENGAPASGGSSGGSSRSITVAAGTAWVNPARPPKVAKPVKEKAAAPKKPGAATAAEVKQATKQVAAATEQASSLVAAVAALPASARELLSGIMQAIYTFLTLIRQTLASLLELIV
jgi:hypothetical protein